MRKVYVAIGFTVVLFLLLASAFAFALTLQNLHINAGSFSQSLVVPVAVDQPMTSAEEGEIAAPTSDTVRFAEFKVPEHLCQKDKDSNPGTDF